MPKGLLQCCQVMQKMDKTEAGSLNQIIAVAVVLKYGKHFLTRFF